MRRLFLLYFIIGSTGLISCAGETEVEDIDEVLIDTMAVDSVETVAAFHANPLPSPLQIAMLFQSAGLPYSEQVVNAPEKANGYDNNFKALLNLGVYSADLTYCVLNEQQAAAKQYLKPLELLAEQTGFGEVYHHDNNLEKFEQSIDDLDSMLTFISNLQMHADHYVNHNDEHEKAYIIFTGAWVESMYFGASLKDAEDGGAIGSLLEQADILRDLIAALSNVEDGLLKDDLPNLIAQLSGIDEVFNAIEGIDGDEVVVTTAQINALTERIIAMRTSIVAP